MKFYRNWVGVVGRFSYRELGDLKEAFTEVEFVRGNLQPWKDSVGALNSSSGVFIFEDYFLLYTRKKLEFEQPESIPEDAEGVTFDGWWFFYDNKWYNVLGDEDWSQAGRNPKHQKYYGKYASGNADIIEGVGVPIPLAELVDNFELIVSELEQVSNLI
jgi:hypothetical protein